MNAKKITVYGETTVPGVWVYVAKASRFHSFFIYVGKTGFKHREESTAPLQRLAAHLNDDEFFNCISTHIKERSWDVRQCHLEVWCYGPFEDIEACKGKTWEDINAVALQVESSLASFIRGAGYDVMRRHGDPVPVADSEEPRFTANCVLAEILPDLNSKIRLLAEVEDDSPEDDSPEDDSPEDDSPEDDSPEDDSPEDDSPEDISPEDEKPKS
jgi:hypothetical protein